MPLQKIETVDEPRARTEAQGGLFDARKPHLDDFRNMLIWGDNKLIIASLLKTFKGKVDLIYIDPPFDVGADFTSTSGRDLRSRGGTLRTDSTNWKARTSCTGPNGGRYLASNAI